MLALERRKIDRNKSTYQGLCEAQFLCQSFARKLPTALIISSEKVAHEVTGRTGLGRWTKGKQQKWYVEGWISLALWILSRSAIAHTSGLELLGADLDEFLDLIRRDFCAGPGLFPARLRRCYGLVPCIACLRRARRIFGSENLLEEGHAVMWVSIRGSAPFCLAACAVGVGCRAEGFSMLVRERDEVSGQLCLSGRCDDEGRACLVRQQVVGVPVQVFLSLLWRLQLGRGSDQ